MLALSAEDPQFCFSEQLPPPPLPPPLPPRQKGSEEKSRASLSSKDSGVKDGDSRRLTRTLKYLPKHIWLSIVLPVIP